MAGEVDLDQSEVSLAQEKSQLEGDISLLQGQLDSGVRESGVDQRLVQLKKRLAEINGMEALIVEEKKSRLKSILDSIKTQRAFSAVREIKENVDALNTSRGQEGSITLAANTDGFALLRSKKPLLALLGEVADALIGLCAKSGAVLLTEMEREQTQSAQFAARRLTELNDRLKKLTGAKPQASATPSAMRGAPTLTPSVAPAAVSGVFAGAQLLGLSLETLNGMARMLRTDRDIGVFDSGTEAMQLLGYLLEAKGKVAVAGSMVTGQLLLDEAFVLLEQLGTLQGLVTVGKERVDQGEADAQLKSTLESADSLLLALNPANQPDAFWNQVKGQALANAIHDRERLFLDLKAQTIQVSEKKWYRGQRIYATGEVQVAYRVFKADDSLKMSGILLKASRMDAAQISSLEALEWTSQ